MTYRRVLIGVVHATYNEDTGQQWGRLWRKHASRTRARRLETQASSMGRGDTILVSRIGWSRSPGVGSGLRPVLQDTVGLS